MRAPMQDLSLILEAILMASEVPLSENKLRSFLDEDEFNAKSIKIALKELEEKCTDRAYELKHVASGWRFQVKDTYSLWVTKLLAEKPKSYSRALLETLSLIAYRQPITRGEIEEVRGVSVSTQIIRTLQERDWVKIIGYKDVPGRPAMYVTTSGFLDYFNLKNLEGLPELAEVKSIDKIDNEESLFLI
jgi:segregation and condensation protein B